MVFKTTAVFYEDHYRHFGIHPMSASLYGDKVEDIVNVICKKIGDYETRDKTRDNKQHYWGFVENGELKLIYPSFVSLSVCFPYGIKAVIERGGEVYEFEVKQEK